MRFHLLLLAYTSTISAYVDFGTLTLPPIITQLSVPRPYRLPPDDDLVHHARISMITGVAPSITMAGNGSYMTMYSLQYHHLFTQTRQGRGVFKRGVFANDPPLSTCTPCDGSGNSASRTSSTSTTSTSSCTIVTYRGVFQFPDPRSQTANYCYDSNYSGIFQPSTTTTTGLPCCFTIPASCRANSSTSASSTYTSGVFRSTSVTTSYNLFTSGFASPSSPLPSIPSSTSTASSVYTTSSMTSSSTNVPSSTLLSVNSSAVPDTSPPSALSTSSTPRSTLSVVTATPPVVVSTMIITTTTTVVPNTVQGCGTASGSGTVIGSGTVYIGPGGFIPIASSGTVSGFASKVVGCGTIIATSGSFTGSATIIGCGEGSGSARLTGTGTVWPAAGGGIFSYVSTGIVEGIGRVKGCGTIVGSGTFSATAPYTSPVLSTVYLTPTRTTIEVYISYCPDPNMMGDPNLPRVMSNTSMRVVNEDNETNTTPFDPVLWPISSTTPANIFTSNMIPHPSSTFPPGNLGQAYRYYALTNTSTSLSPNPSPFSAGVYSNNTTLQNTTITTPQNSTSPNAICTSCPNTAGVCLPPGILKCDPGGYVPWTLLETGGFTLNGYNLFDVKNSSVKVVVDEWGSRGRFGRW